MSSHLRSIHGGAGSHLCIEVSAVRGFGEPGGITVCNDDEASAAGYGVYIRNPLAFHVQDFGVETTFEERRATLLEAKAAAFTYAAGLAEHLGCEVVSVLNRHTDPTAAAPRQPAAVDPLTAMVLWEAVLDGRAGNIECNGAGVPMGAMFDRHGTCTMRDAIAALAPKADALWQEARERGFDAPFDWEFAPRFVALALDWTGRNLELRTDLADFWQSLDLPA